MENKDRLSKVFSMQKQLNEYITTNRHLEFTKEEWIQKHVLAMLAELAELLDEVNFKWWKNPKEIDEKALKGEIVDIFHFLLSMCLYAGMDSDELFNMYKEKVDENFARQNGTSKKTGYDFKELKK